MALIVLVPSTALAAKGGTRPPKHAIYRGTSSQGVAFEIVVSGRDARRASLYAGVDVLCSNGASLTFNGTDRLSVRRDGSYAQTSKGTGNSPDLGHYTYTRTVAGSFDRAVHTSGNLRIRIASTSGVSCDSGVVTFKAVRPLAIGGRYLGSTAQGTRIKFLVTRTGDAIVGGSLRVRVPCQGGVSTVKGRPGAVIRSNGHFSAKARSPTFPSYTDLALRGRFLAPRGVRAVGSVRVTITQTGVVVVGGRPTIRTIRCTSGWIRFSLHTA